MLVAFLTFWEVAARLAHNIGIATFSDTMVAAWDLMFGNGRIWEAMLSSNAALVLGFAISAVTAVPLGLAAGRSRILDRALSPYTAILLAIPVAPLVPIAITAFGLSLAARVSIVILFAVIFIYVNTRAGVRSVDQRLVEMAHAFGASERTIWTKVVIPSAVPAMFAGLRIGLGRALTGMVAVELLLVATGVGKLLLEYRDRLQPAYVFATVLFVIVEALLLLELARFIERKVAPWND